MDLVEANRDGSASSDPLNSSSDGTTTNPSPHSQAAINIVHVTLPQAQVKVLLNVDSPSMYTQFNI